ncbi:hypothetical protein NOR51B_1746 [Luminiphilus syltensis NOR5-1B]|uniref:Uncharacterized protein n=1 Tax=Luminiphilus syltensis NOR5-1B TaxID=565045 RepID=B8KS99_9GAMM|nr:hypothetical protein NOR51B_1746 [Luminiphilus syltensis NOR5-1B]
MIDPETRAAMESRIDWGDKLRQPQDQSRVVYPRDRED